MSKRPADRLHCRPSNHRNAESPAAQRQGSGGTTYSGRIHFSSGGAGSLSASPTANPVGRQRRLALKNHPGRWLAPMIVALALASPNPAIAASPGGVGPDRGTPPAETAPTESGCATEASGVSSTAACAPAKKARLVGGKAIAPSGAPAGVRRRSPLPTASTPSPTSGAAGTDPGIRRAMTVPAQSALRFTVPSSSRLPLIPGRWKGGDRRVRAAGSRSTPTRATPTR